MNTHTQALWITVICEHMFSAAYIDNAGYCTYNAASVVLP